MSRSFKIFLMTGAMVSVLGAAGCSPTINTRGNLIESDRYASINPGESTRTDVLRAMCSPTTQAPFDENVWYYIGQKTEKRGIFDPDVIEEKIVVVAFDDAGIVEVCEPIDADRINIPIERDKTRTGGHSVTFLQQLLGNVGRFNKSEGPVGTPGPSN